MKLARRRFLGRRRREQTHLVPDVQRNPAVVRSEWTKIRSVRSTVWSLFATFGITVGLGALFCFAYVRRYDHLNIRQRLTFDPTVQSLRGLFLAQIAIGVLGVLVISSEYATGLIRTTLTAVPQRRTLLAAKAVVFGALNWSSPSQTLVVAPAPS